ncbi:MAG: hypothetical protein A2Z18_04615 [Armatimonadetes bacterium RBG_16_58_9]|nr:MAG: hypothetical protein A2Z18_04615 [Armatimonadetes bacterium RBG_16_58_9]
MSGSTTYVLFRRRTFFLFVAPIILILIARPTPRVFWIGLPFAIVGELIRVWSAGYLSKLSKLVTAGPFALCRNPLYVGSFLISVGYFFTCNRMDAWIGGVALFWLFHGGAVIYEERLLRDAFGEDFEEYCRNVPRFLPRFSAGWRFPNRHPLPAGWRFPNRHPEGSFSWKQFMLNNEYRGVIATALLSVAFGFIAYRPDFAPLNWIIRSLG